MRKEKRKGTIILVGFGLSAGVTTSFFLTSKRYSSDVKQARTAYEESLAGLDLSFDDGELVINEHYNSWQNSYNKGKDAQRIFYYAAAASAAIWAYSLIDSLSGKSKNRAKENTDFFTEKIAIAPIPNTDSSSNSILKGISVSISF